MLRFAGRPSTMSSLTQVELPQNCMVGQQRQQVSELQFDNFLHPQSFLVWKIRFKNQAIACSDFPSERMLWIKEMEMVESFDECVSSRSTAGKDFPNFEMLDAKIASARTRSSRTIPVQEEGQSRWPERPEGGPVSTRKTDRLSWSTTTFEWLALMIQCWIMLTSSLLLFMIAFRNSTHDGWSSTINVKDSIRWHLGKSVHIENTWVRATQNRIGSVRHGESSEYIGAQLSKKKKKHNGEKEYRSKTTITNLWRQARENWNRSSDQESKGIKWRWSRKRYLLPVERKRPMFEGRPVQFSAWEWRSCSTKTRTRMPPHILSQPHHEVEVCRGRQK